MPLLAVLLIAVPLVFAALAAGTLALAGERRMLQIGAPLWSAVLITGIVVSALMTVILLIRRARTQRVAAVEAAHSAGIAEGIATGEARANESHRLFLARLDHELKNPLTAIRATAAGREGADWTRVDRQAGRLSDVVRDLRKLAELETRTLALERVDLEAVVREAAEALVQLHPDVASRLRIDVVRVPWPVPPVTVDLDLLSLALDNVLGNAVKYSETGPIEVRLREEGGWALVEVADSGRGIPEGDVPLVFGQLARAGNVRDVAGSGLGLALVAIVMARHGGRASVRSVEGAGSVFTLRLAIGEAQRELQHPSPDIA